MATIEKRTTRDGSIVYRVKVRRKGVATQTATFPRLRDAQTWAHVIEGAVVTGRHFTITEAKRRTLGEMIDRYLRDVLPTKKDSTARDQRRQLEWWRERLGRHTIADVTPARIAACRDVLTHDRANATAVRYLAALSHAFTVAVKEWGWCDDNPVRKVRRPREPRGRVRFLSDDERIRLLSACRKSRNPYLYTIVVFALSTGIRSGELLSLTWRDVDLTRGLVVLHDTKNGERRAIPITGYALELLRQYAQRRIHTDVIFPNYAGTQTRSMRRAWENAVRRAKIDDFRFHDLRHSAASYLAMNGASLMEITEILGHKTLAMVKQYAHLSEPHTRNVVERMNRAVFESR